MSEEVKNSTERIYYLPGDATRTPLSHDDYVAIMRDSWQLRKKLQRAGECNAPASHPCCCDCCNCPYRTEKRTVSLDGLMEAGFDAGADPDIVGTVIRKILMEQVKGALPKLDTIDRIIITAKFLREPVLSDRECAAVICKVTGQTVSHQAVSKRLPKALERLSRLVNDGRAD